MKIISAAIGAAALLQTIPVLAQEAPNARVCLLASDLVGADRELAQETDLRIKLDKLTLTAKTEASIRDNYIAFDQYVTASNYKAEKVAGQIIAAGKPNEAKAYRFYNFSGNFYAGGTPDGTMPAPEKQLGAITIHYASFAGRGAMTAQGWKFCVGHGPLYNNKIHADFSDKSITLDETANDRNAMAAAAMSVAVIGAKLTNKATPSTIDFDLGRAPAELDNAPKALQPQITRRLNASKAAPK